ncbi:hypothetical protein FACS1894116_14790 [Betaproteobacteria bacterium]|nr:hypothetical protein FACS1894116_14790 [Betaproteobacteria bacterium]
MIVLVCKKESDFFKTRDEIRAMTERRNGVKRNPFELPQDQLVKVRANEPEDVKLFRKAAEQGNAEAQAQAILGGIYLAGLGVKQSDSEAFFWISKAAEQGDTDGQSLVGHMYREGRGVSQSDTDAAKWFGKAAEQGDSQAQLELGDSFAAGKGVKQSDTEAVEWFRRAAEQGDEDAQRALSCYGDEVYETAANRNAETQYVLGMCYAKGRRVAQSDTEAAKWFNKSAVQGNVQAQFKLGISYAKGKGVAQSNTEAIKWLRKAAEHGDEEMQQQVQVALGLHRLQ